MNNNENYSGWGNFPILSKNQVETLTIKNKQQALQFITSNSDITIQGNGRSYGDSALGKVLLVNKKNNHFLDFDANNGVLHCQSGVLLADIIIFFLPRGWFPAITPGTKFVSIGGAIASDVHGKNHHHVGAFSSCVLEIELMLASGEIVTCSKKENSEIFQATCGGMGLTGFILSAKIQLLAIKSQYIEQVTVKTKSLAETFQFFEKYKDSTYSVAWIDCLAQGENLGRSIITFGEHANDGDLNYRPKKSLNLPFNFPGFALNSLSLKMTNTLLYQRVRKNESRQKVSFESFFYPLDAIHNWNRLYGKRGFLQYQFVLPLENSLEGMTAILNEISRAKKGSFLAVLKLFGEGNDNYLSFPMKGYTLALDFKNEPGTFALFERLDKLVCHYGGRFYLAKDARISKHVFEQNYPHIETFRNFRKTNNMDKTFSSLQAKRLAL